MRLILKALIAALSLSLLSITTYQILSTKKNIVIIGFTGDVMLGRLVNEKLKETSPTYPWGNILPLLKKTNLNIINLETAITAHTKATPKVFNFRTDPEHVETLKKGNIEVVNLANNHILDFGKEGLYETLNVLEKAHIKYVGAGKNIQEAQKAVIIEKKGIRFGIIGFTDNEPDWKATAANPGTNYIKVGDIDIVQKVVNNVRSQVDFLIASIHWGPNMREKPTQEFIDFAHQMIDAGIDIIHGHSAHIFQGIEVYKNKLILYDTGDFIDDYMIDPKLRNDISFFYEVYIEKNALKKLKLTPVYIENMQVNLAAGKEYEWAINHVQQLSKEFDTQISNEGIYQFKY
ncbi:MAG: CapA family protein [Candidatus Babeliales bacterium]